MATIVTRAGKGSGLTDAEADGNFINLNNESIISTRNGKPWVASSAVVVGEILIAENTRYYLVTVAGNTGTTVPNHVSGTVSNGTASLQYYIPTPNSPKDILDKVKLVDGIGSGLDADTLDGLQASQIIENAVADSLALAVALG